MYFFSISCAAVLALASVCTSTAHAAVLSANGIVRLPLSRNKNGQLAHLRRLLVQENDIEKRADTASLYNAQGREYFVEVGVGTPAQRFNLTLDTGSAEFWIPSTSCPTSKCPYSRFDTSKSSTLQTTNMPFSIEYGIGSANGTYAKETVTVGTAQVENQMIGLVSSTENILGIVSEGEQSNGILGLGFPGLNSVRGAKDDIPFAFNLASKLQDPVFSIFLNKPFAYGMTGEIMFGGVDAAKYTGSLQYVPVASYDTSGFYVTANVGTSSKSGRGTFLYWTVAGQGIKAGSSYSKSLSSLQGFILDTGTTLTMIPKQYADGILEAVAGGNDSYSYDAFNGVYRVSCSLAKSTDSVEFQLSTSTSSASTNPVVISTPVSQLVIPLDTDYTETAESCMFGITSSSSTQLTSGETWILGEASLRSVYSVYDMKNYRVGVAPANLAGANVVSAAKPQKNAIHVASHAPSSFPSTTTNTTATSTTLSNNSPTKTNPVTNSSQDNTVTNSSANKPSEGEGQSSGFPVVRHSLSGLVMMMLACAYLL